MTEYHDELMEVQEDTQRNKFLTFSIGNEGYGIEIRYVTEIIGIQTITEVPDLPEYARGIINLRGKIIPVIDVRLRFKKDFREYDDRTCIIVVDINHLSIGFIVDQVSEVLDIEDTEIVPPPQLDKNYHHKYIKGIGKVGDEVILILDCEKLLSDDLAEFGEVIS